jgi:hypothetical protein
MKTLVILLGMLLLSGCQSADPLSGERDPKDPWWSLDFMGPSYMIGVVEHSAVEDVNGKLINQPGGPALGTGTPSLDTESARGWRGMVGNLVPVTGAALPNRIYVRWQSVVEPQTYQAWIDIPEETRQLMHSSTHRRCAKTPEKNARYTASMVLGLAPGGVVQVWVRNSCRTPIKVTRAQGEVVPLGPRLGKSGGNYYPQSEKSKRYIEKYGIPYGSW